MVHQVEEHSLHGLRQLRRVRDLMQEGRRALVERYFGDAPDEVNVETMLLVRSSVGSAKVWQTKGDVTLANLPLLAVAVLSVTADPGRALAQLGARTSELLDELVDRSLEAWEQTSVDLGVVEVEQPVLRLDPAQLHRARVDVVRAMRDFEP